MLLISTSIIGKNGMLPSRFALLHAHSLEASIRKEGALHISTLQFPQPSEWLCHKNPDIGQHSF